MSNAIPHWLRQRVLPVGVSMQVLTTDETIVFQSSGKWLHPLIELEAFLHSSSHDPRTLILHDQVQGRAAAALTIRLGFVAVKARMMSRHACSLFDLHDVDYCYDELVERISCMTEQLIDDSMEIDAIHAMILKRSGR